MKIIIAADGAITVRFPAGCFPDRATVEKLAEEIKKARPHVDGMQTGQHMNPAQNSQQ